MADARPRAKPGSSASAATYPTLLEAQIETLIAGQAAGDPLSLFRNHAVPTQPD